MIHFLAALLQVGLGHEDYAVRAQTTAVVGLANQFLPLDGVLDRLIRAEDLEVRWRASALRGALLDPAEVSGLRFVPGDRTRVFATQELFLEATFRPTWARVLAERHLSPRNACRVLTWAQLAGLE